MKRAGLIFLAASACVLDVARADAKAHEDCLTAAESREAVSVQKLARPAAVQREAAARARAEPLRSRLCRWNNELVYEITLLRPDGKLTHVSVRAKDGLVVNTADD